MAACPPADRTLDGTCAREGEKVLEGGRGIVGAVGPKAVVALLGKHEASVDKYKHEDESYRQLSLTRAGGKAMYYQARTTKR